MDVHRLRLLRELSRHGTIAAAATSVSLTPSAVSQQLSRLEREAGAPLFIRSGRTLELTEAARVLVEHTERVLAELERAGAAVAELTSSVRGLVRLSAFPSAARSLVPGALARCRAENADLYVRLVEHEPAAAIDALTAGSVDVAIVYDYSVLPRIDDPAVHLVPLVSEALVAAVPAISGDGGPVDLSTLSGESWIAPDSDTDLRLALERLCGMAGFEPRLDYATDDYGAILALVEHGLGVSLLPRMASYPAGAGVSLRTLAGADPTRNVYAAVRKGSAERPPVRAVLAALTAAGGSHSTRI